MRYRNYDETAIEGMAASGDGIRNQRLKIGPAAEWPSIERRL